MENWNSTVNQEIKRKFVNREVLAPVNLLVEYVLSHESPNAPFSFDDITNLYYYEDAVGNTYSETEKDDQLETWSEELLEAELKLEEDPDNAALISRISALENDIEALENAEQQIWEIYEWWMVTPWLAHKLENYGEPMLTNGQNHYWGRSTTGQGILLDSVISRICEDMEILHGMRKAWL
ncbi:hypothetical protein LS482_17350 [Sinomicrobium kalidii]|uniref:hypothetical protein n=1 Tax=Sinomicrobium kalidii TaxID=2900738 RepID=UPI001E4F592E|nr:hypothetical protein [Sinomicrobium kalidii]UGU15436.1 hypothetical protein LS482_17350 [Sinomicrobium kalidii]